jgi:hypothetical protein
MTGERALPALSAGQLVAACRSWLWGRDAESVLSPPGTQSLCARRSSSPAGRATPRTRATAW